MALAGVAMGDTYSLRPLADKGERHGDWDLLNRIDANNEAYLTPRIEEGVVCTYNFYNPIVLKQKGDSLTFTYDYRNQDGDFALTLSFLGINSNGDKAVIATGHGGYKELSADAQAAYANVEVGKTGFVFAENSLHDDFIQVLGNQNNIVGGAPAFYTTTLTGVIAWSDTANQFQLTLSSDKTSNTIIPINLGSSFTATDMVITSAGRDESLGKISKINLMVNIVPEPTTATLSLLALAGLAARRRRK